MFTDFKGNLIKELVSRNSWAFVPRNGLGENPWNTCRHFHLIFLWEIPGNFRGFSEKLLLGIVSLFSKCKKLYLTNNVHIIQKIAKSLISNNFCYLKNNYLEYILPVKNRFPFLLLLTKITFSLFFSFFWFFPSLLFLSQIMCTCAPPRYWPDKWYSGNKEIIMMVYHGFIFKNICERIQKTKSSDIPRYLSLENPVKMSTAIPRNILQPIQGNFSWRIPRNFS